MRQKILCFDIGSKVIGVAISDAFGTVAFPRPEIHWGGNLATFEQELRTMLKDEPGIRDVVVGVPPEPSPSMTKAFETVTLLLKRLGLAVHPVDEHVTTAEAKNKAEDIELETGVPFPGGRLDSLAAQIILERYFSL